MRKFKLPEKDLTLGYDVRILFSVLFLTGIGIVMVYSASSALALKKFGTGYYFLKKQAIFALTGLLVMGVFRYISLRIFGDGGFQIYFIENPVSYDLSADRVCIVFSDRHTGFRAGICRRRRNAVDADREFYISTF